MKGVKTVWFCNNCGAESAKWVGRCPSCGEWNTMTEEKVKEKKGRTSGLTERTDISTPVPVSAIETADEPRIKMPSEELNRVLGGGLVPGSIILIGGEPGIGVAGVGHVPPGVVGHGVRVFQHLPAKRHFLNGGDA